MILNLPGCDTIDGTYIYIVGITDADGQTNGYLNQDPEDIEKMRVAGRLAAEVLEMIEPYVKPGVSTGELDRICNDYIVNEQTGGFCLPRLSRLSEIRLHFYQ